MIDIEPRSVVVASLIALALLGGLAYYTDVGESNLPVDSQQVCNDELGEDWEAAGVAYHEDWDVAHVKCERETGLFSSNTQWVTVDMPVGVPL